MICTLCAYYTPHLKLFLSTVSVLKESEVVDGFERPGAALNSAILQERKLEKIAILVQTANP